MTYKTLKDNISTWDAYANGLLTPSSLINQSAILLTGMAMPASNKTFDRQRVIVGLNGVSTVDINGTFSSSAATDKIVLTQLKVTQTYLEIDPILANGYPNGIDDVIAGLMDTFMTSLSNGLGKRAIYGTAVDSTTFKGIRLVAILNGNVTSAGTTTGSTYTSILVVKWDPKGCTWIYNPDNETTKLGIFNLDILPLQVIGTATDTRKKAYPVMAYTDLTLKIADPSCVHAIVNIKLGTNDLTDKMLRDAIAAVRGNRNNTFIYASRAGANAISALVDGNINLMNGYAEYNSVVNSYNYTAVAVDDNISDALTYVTV